MEHSYPVPAKGVGWMITTPRLNIAYPAVVPITTAGYGCHNRRLW